MRVLITGAAGGLGRALAIECAGRGYDLILTDINNLGLELVKQGILRQYDVDVYITPCDLTNDEEVEKLIQQAEERGLRIDMLFNVAGLDYEGGFMQRNFEQISRILRVNIEATLRVTYRALRLRKKNSRFQIVFVSSLASQYPIPLKATYAASKRFLYDFSLALGQELKGEDVSVLVLCPGGLATTEEAINGITAQGFWGSATTNKLEKVARRTITRALRGRRTYIPGVLNRLFSLVGKVVPADFAVKILYHRWVKAQKKWLMAK